MTKQELLENCSAEQLADMVEELDNENTDLKEELLKKTGLCGEAKVSFGLSGIECCCGGYDIAVKKNKELQSEVEKYRKAFEDAKKERDCQIAEYQKKIEKLENHHKFSIMQIDDVLVEFLGVTHEIMDNPSDFEKVLQEVIDKSKTISDFLPTEPIKVADMLINASKKRTNCMTGKEYGKYIFEKWKLRQIAEHLIVYCNHNGEAEKDE